MVGDCQLPINPEGYIVNKPASFPIIYHTTVPRNVSLCIFFLLLPIHNCIQNTFCFVLLYFHTLSVYKALLISLQISTLSTVCACVLVCSTQMSSPMLCYVLQIYLLYKVSGQYPPGQYPPRTKSPRTISPRSNIPPDNIPPDDISSKTCFSKKNIFNSSVLNYPKTCVGK